MVQTITAKSIIDQLSKELKWFDRPDGTKFVKRDVEGNSEDIIRDIIFEAHGELMPDDTTYEFIMRVANHLSDMESETIEDMTDDLRQIEPDVYTSDLTGWLNKSNMHIYYLTQALEEFEPKDGFQLLTIAQQLHIQEVGDSLLCAIEKRIEE